MCSLVNVIANISERVFAMFYKSLKGVVMKILLRARPSGPVTDKSPSTRDMRYMI